MMNICRTCLKTSANKDMAELEKSLKEDNKNYRDIMLFCLDIKVTEDSKITSNLCKECYRKILSFYKFKVLSMKNDAYLKSISTVVPVVPVVEHKPSVYVDEDGIKRENCLDINKLDDYGPSIVEDRDSEFKIEINLKYEESSGHRELDEEAISASEEMKSENIQPMAVENITIGEFGEDSQYLPQNIKRSNESKKRKKKKQTSPSNKKQGRPKQTKPKEEHSKQEYEMCEECGKSFRNLKEHIIRHQPKDKRQMVQCKVCPKLFFTKRGQKNHYKTAHLGIKSKCDICDKGHTQRSAHTHVKSAGSRSLSRPY